MRPCLSCVAVCLGFGLSAAFGAETPEEQLARMEKKYAEVTAQFEKKFEKAESERDRVRLLQELQEEQNQFVSLLDQFADKYRGKEVALDALCAIVSNSELAGKLSPQSPLSKALNRLLSDYPNSPKLEKLLPGLARTPGASGQYFLQVWIDKTTSRKLKGLAHFALAYSKTIQSLYSSELKKNEDLRKMFIQLVGEEQTKQLLNLDPAQNEKERIALFTTIRKEYGDLKEIQIGQRELREPRTLGQVADQFLFELSNLKIGSPAPALESVDLNGKKVRLSELRGKVVVLDFWATWCGPCLAMIPDQRKLVERFGGKPLVLVSISVDDERDTVINFQKKQPMPWPQWFNGSQGGALDSWNVFSFPTIYVVDAEGIIRAKNVRGAELEKTIAELLKVGK